MEISKHWTEDEIKYLKTFWRRRTDRFISSLLGKTVTSVKNKRVYLGLIKKPLSHDSVIAQRVKKMKTLIVLIEATSDPIAKSYYKMKLRKLDVMK